MTRYDDRRVVYHWPHDSTRLGEPDIMPRLVKIAPVLGVDLDGELSQYWNILRG
jgi:hypothetical protein